MHSRLNARQRPQVGVAWSPKKIKVNYRPGDDVTKYGVVIMGYLSERLITFQVPGSACLTMRMRKIVSITEPKKGR
jgi:hypothetical protein